MECTYLFTYIYFLLAQSCTKVALDFVSPENLHKCIRFTRSPMTAEELDMYGDSSLVIGERLSCSKVLIFELYYASLLIVAPEILWEMENVLNPLFLHP